jgi:hypothetical protein
MVFTTSAGGDFGAGRSYTRFAGPLLVGSEYTSQLPGNGGIIPPHLVNVSSLRGDLLIAVVSTFASTAGSNVSTALPTGLVYISQTAGHLIAAGSTANVPVGLPGGKNGAALCWDSTMLTLAVYDPLSSAWMWPHWAGSSGATIVWSASSS